jgi:hypothetical protein
MHWLATGTPREGLEFGRLSTLERQGAVLSHVMWAESGGLAGQARHTQQTLSGQHVGTVRVVAEVTNETWPAGTRIWFGNPVHTMAAVQESDGRFLVYDPNTGRTEDMTLPAFRAFIRTFGANAFVVAEPGH